MTLRSRNTPITNSEVKSVMRSRRKQDLKEIIHLVLQSPLKSRGDVMQADGNVSMEELSKANTDVQTRMILQITKSACVGDVKSARFIAEYGGMEPPKQQHLTMELPTIIDDMTCRATPVVASAFAAKMESDGEGDEESEDDD